MNDSAVIHPSSLISPRSSLSSLLLLRLSALGDVIHTIPAVVALRDALPGARMAWVVEAPYRELVEVVANVEAIPVSMKRWGRSLIASRREILEARRKMLGFDLAIDFQGLVKSAMIPWIARTKRRVGFDRHAIRERAAGLFLNQRVAVDRSRHVVEWNLALAQAVVPEARLRAVDFRQFAADPDGKLRRLEGSIVVLPGAGKLNKQWPAERFGQLPRDRVIAAWGPGEEALARQTGLHIAPPTNLRELAWLLAHARLVVAGDTGPLHLAAALGTPVLGLFGPTNPARNGPYGQLDHVVKRESMQDIDVSAVAGIVKRYSG